MPGTPNRDADKAQRFIIQRAGKVLGPLTLANLRHIVDTRQVTASCPAKRVGDTDWVTIEALLARPSGQVGRGSGSPPPRADLPAGPPIDRPVRKAMRDSGQGDDYAGGVDGARKQGMVAIREGGKAIASVASVAKTLVKAAVSEAQKSIDDSEWITVDQNLVIGRSSPQSDWLVPDPSVSARQARVQNNNGSLLVTDLGGKSGTILNDVKLKRRQAYPLKDSDIIGIGPARFRVEGCSLRVLSSGSHAHLVCRDLCKDVTSTTGGGKLRILRDVSLDIEPRNFVVLLGPSGSGKSTLMNALCGRSAATAGNVLLNNEDLYRSFDRLKTRLAIVPQKDLLHDRLTLESSLRYTAALRLPTDLSRAEKKQRVQQVIAEVEMNERARARISTYSGGQTKRASLANELLPQPSLLFIDEATSGLDEHSDREIMAMLRKLADAGKTILCITHNLGNVEEYATQVVVMANGGYLAFVGTPSEALEHFGIRRLGELYGKLKDVPGSTWAKRFQSTAHGRGATARQSVSQGAEKVKIQRESISVFQRLGLAVRHSGVVLRRILELQAKDLASLAVAIAQPVFVFLLIWVVFGDIRDVNASEQGGRSHPSSRAMFSERQEQEMEEYTDGLGILFLLSISTLWFGCSNSAKEIVKERELFERERGAGLSAIGYLSAKSVFLITLTLAQAGGLFVATCCVTGLAEGALEVILYGVCLAAVAACGVGMGLTISVFSSSTDVASVAVPLVIIPEVILAGRVRELEGLAELIAWFAAPSYWCFGALCSVWNLDWDDVSGHERYISEEMFSQEMYVLSIAAVGAFTLMFFLTAAVGLTWKRGRSSV